VEIVDPETGAPVSDGTYGEIVITTLSRKGLPLVRYRTHDMACLLPDEKRCACGMPTRRLSRVRGRLDHLLIIGAGANIYPDELDSAILAVPGISEYQVTIDREGHRDVLGLAVESDESPEALVEKLKQALMTQCIIRWNIEDRKLLVFGEFRVLPHGTLGVGRPKARRIVDLRPMADTSLNVTPDRET
jgi:phenylacetate-CoA ligase